MENVIKIKIKDKKTIKEKKDKSESCYKLIPEKHLELFYNCWVKYTDGLKINSGGFLIKIDLGIAFLKIPRINQTTEIEIHDHLFYVDCNLPNYHSLLYLIETETKLKKLIHRYTHFIKINNLD